MSTRLIQDLHAGISRRDWNAVEMAANSLRDDIEETRRILAGTGISSLPNDYPLSRLATEAKKDGGQEVEAVEWQGRYWIEDEGRWSNWITNPVGYPWAYDLQEGKSEIRYLYPQPASTALVTLRKAVERFTDFELEIVARFEGNRLQPTIRNAMAKGHEALRSTGEVA